MFVHGWMYGFAAMLRQADMVFVESVRLHGEQRNLVLILRSHRADLPSRLCVPHLFVAAISFPARAWAGVPYDYTKRRIAPLLGLIQFTLLHCASRPLVRGVCS